MATVTCSYIIPGGGRGGRLQGPGFPGNNPPSLSNGDTLAVSVQWTGPNAPQTLTGYFIFTPVASADVNQVFASPFKPDGQYLCYDVQLAAQASANGATTFTFPGYQYGGGLVGRYELTFIAETGSDTPDVAQWSSDPEFDTSN